MDLLNLLNEFLHLSFPLLFLDSQKRVLNFKDGGSGESGDGGVTMLFWEEEGEEEEDS
jgi:hypothetical protein